MAIYLKYDGIEGSVTAKGFEKQIEVGSAGFQSGRAIETAQRSLDKRERAEPHISEIQLNKQWDDTSSGKLFEEGLAGKCKKALLSFTTGGNPPVAYLTVELENALVSRYSISGSSDGHPSENFSLNFTKITVTPYTVKDGKATKGAVRSYDLTQMKAND